MSQIFKSSNYLIIAAITLSIVLSSCNENNGNENSQTVPVTGVTLSQTSATLTSGNTLTLTPTIIPANAANQNVSWASNNITVATIDNGTVTAVAPGNATITVTTQDGAKTAACAVTVNIVAVTGVKLNRTVTTRLGGATFTLTATVLPENADNKAVTWFCNNTTVATVNNGTVTTYPPQSSTSGTARITVTTQDGGKMAECVLTVHGSTYSVVNLLDGVIHDIGMVTRGTERTISGNGIFQIWSDAVKATSCLTNKNCCCNENGYPGDLFSWYSVVFFQDELCPAPWRVPSREDFINLDKALGGTGNNNQSNTTLRDKYINNWGGAFGGFLNYGMLSNQGSMGYYWSLSYHGYVSSPVNAHHAYDLRILLSGSISPQDHQDSNGCQFSLRCVRDN